MDKLDAILQPEQSFVDEKWEEFLRQTDGAQGYSPSALAFARHAFEHGLKRGAIWRVLSIFKAVVPQSMESFRPSDVLEIEPSRDAIVPPGSRGVGAEVIAKATADMPRVEPDWQPIATAPKNATWVDVRMADGTVYRAHWACDMSGEEQPAFKGWFIRLTPQSRDFTGIPDPVAWRPAP